MREAEKVKDVIVIAGAPGTGKSSVARELQKHYQSPLFEFGWIPEFRQRGNEIIPYTEEEGIAFENLLLVTNNYLKHGFKNIILTDLEDSRILSLHEHLSNCVYVLITLVVSDDEILKKRILEESRSSEYRDWETGLTINHKILSRDLLPHEIRIDATKQDIAEITEAIIQQLDESN